MIPYTQHTVTPEDEAAVLEVLRSPYLAQGPKVEEFEAALAQKAGAKYCVCVSSGTAALQAAFAAIHVPRDRRRLVTTPITFVATANAASSVGFPVSFADVNDRGIWNPHKAVLEHPNVVICVVTLRGEPVPVDLGVGRPVVIVDACHGPLHLPLGAVAACFSFHPAKHVACGEGGAVVTNDEGFARLCRAYRDHGRVDGKMEIRGGNYRMSEMAAALGLSQLARYEDGVARRREIAMWYDLSLGYMAVLQPKDSAYHLYQLLVDRRDQVREALRACRIGTQVHYLPVYRHPWWARDMLNPNPPPKAEQFASRVLSIPLYPTLTDTEVEYVASTVKRVVEEVHVHAA